MKNLPQILSVAAMIAVGLILSPRAIAVVSDDDFNTLKAEVQQMNQKMEALQQTNQQDQQKIHDLKEQLQTTQTMAEDAQQKAETAAQPPPPPNATHNFTLAGDAEFQFGRVTGQHGTFVQADFAPVFLYRANDNILFEAGFDIMQQNNGFGTAGSSTNLNLSFAQLDYLYNDYVTVVAGEMLLPLGTYTERNAGWLNKIPDAPLARNFLPSTSPGIQLRGSVPIGESGQQFTYSIYGVNGPSSVDGTGTSSSLDLNDNVGDTPNAHDPSGGGRLGWLYVFKPHYDFELGISGQSGVWDNAGQRGWTAGVLDASLHIGSDFEMKGEYISTWEGTDEQGTIRPNGWWVQSSYKLSGLNIEAPLINNVELVGRYDTADDAFGTKADRYTAGGIYYFTNTLLFEGDYEFLNVHGPNPGALPSSDLILQLSYGF